MDRKYSALDATQWVETLLQDQPNEVGYEPREVREVRQFEAKTPFRIEVEEDAAKVQRDLCAGPEAFRRLEDKYDSHYGHPALKRMRRKPQVFELNWSSN